MSDILVLVHWNSANAVLTLTHISCSCSRYKLVSKNSTACTSLVKSLTLQVSINLMTHIQTAAATERGDYLWRCLLLTKVTKRSFDHKRKMLHQDKFGVNYRCLGRNYHPSRMIELRQKQPLQTSGLCQTEVWKQTEVTKYLYKL